MVSATRAHSSDSMAASMAMVAAGYSRPGTSEALGRTAQGGVGRRVREGAVRGEDGGKADNREGTDGVYSDHEASFPRTGPACS